MAYRAFLRLPIVLEIGKYLFDLWNRSRTVCVLQGRNCYPGIWVGLLCRFCLTQLLVWFTKKKKSKHTSRFCYTSLFVCIRADNSWKRNLLVYIGIVFLFFLIYSDHSQQCYILPCLSCTSVYNAVRTILISRTASVALFFSLHIIHLQVLCCRPSVYLHEFYIEWCTCSMFPVFSFTETDA